VNEFRFAAKHTGLYLTCSSTDVHHICQKRDEHRITR